MNLEIQILLNRAGIAADHVGYRYFAQAIEIYIADTTTLYNTMKRIYAPVAKQNNVNTENVARHMDRCLRVAREAPCFRTFMEPLGVFDWQNVKAKRFIAIVGNYYIAYRLKIAPWDETKFKH